MTKARPRILTDSKCFFGGHEDPQVTTCSVTFPTFDAWQHQFPAPSMRFVLHTYHFDVDCLCSADECESGYKKLNACSGDGGNTMQRRRAAVKSAQWSVRGEELGDFLAATTLSQPMKPLFKASTHAHTELMGEASLGKSSVRHCTRRV